MLTKNIKFTNFRGNTNSSNKKKLAKILKNKNLVIEIPLLKSLSKDYQLSYSKKLVSSLKKFKKINLIGMGGSILGTQAIYDFLKDKITKKINKKYFINRIFLLVYFSESEILYCEFKKSKVFMKNWFIVLGIF